MYRIFVLTCTTNSHQSFGIQRDRTSLQLWRLRHLEASLLWREQFRLSALKSEVELQLLWIACNVEATRL